VQPRVSAQLVKKKQVKKKLIPKLPFVTIVATHIYTCATSWFGPLNYYFSQPFIIGGEQQNLNVQV
jgi:hypothetical protein